MKTNRPARTSPWRGVMVATPLTLREDRSIDFDAYAAHVHDLVAEGCDGVVPNGSLGEYQTLTDQERDQVVRVAVEAAGDGARVMPGVSAYDSTQARRRAEQAAEAGAYPSCCCRPTGTRARTGRSVRTTRKSPPRACRSSRTTIRTTPRST